MLDTSCAGSFMKKTIEFRWDLLERIKRNSEDWELDEGKESGIKLKYDCVKSFMHTYAFQKFSTKYGLDSEIVASFCESFATHVTTKKKRQIRDILGRTIFFCHAYDTSMMIIVTKNRYHHRCGGLLLL